MEGKWRKMEANKLCAWLQSRPLILRFIQRVWLSRIEKCFLPGDVDCLGLKQLDLPSPNCKHLVVTHAIRLAISLPTNYHSNISTKPDVILAHKITACRYYRDQIRTVEASISTLFCIWVWRELCKWVCIHCLALFSTKKSPKNLQLRCDGT